LISTSGPVRVGDDLPDPADSRDAFSFSWGRGCARRGQSIADLVDSSAKIRREIVALLSNVRDRSVG
jgi:hypothetical protein